MDNLTNKFNSLVDSNLSWIHENKYILPIVSLFLGIYVALARPKLPNYIEKLFENPVFRLLMISYIIYRGNQNPQLSLMIAVAFLTTMHMINKQQVEKLESQIPSPILTISTIIRPEPIKVKAPTPAKKSASVKSAPVKLAPVKSAPVKSAPVKFAPIKITPLNINP